MAGPLGLSDSAKSPPKYQIQQLWERHHRMIYMRMLGKSNKAIAETLGVAPGNVSNVLNSEIAQRQLKLMQAAANVEVVGLRVRLDRAAPKALDLLESVRDGKGEGEGASLPLRVQVSQDLLDRNRMTSKKVEQHAMVVPVTPEVLTEALTRAAQAAKDRMVSAEAVEFEEVEEEKPQAQIQSAGG